MSAMVECYKSDLLLWSGLSLNSSSENDKCMPDKQLRECSEQVSQGTLVNAIVQRGAALPVRWLLQLEPHSDPWTLFSDRQSPAVMILSD